MKEKERNQKNKNLGAVGITTFKSRSFADWQKSGGKNLMPVFNAEEKIRRGELRPEDVPYMQRPGGKPDNSDLKKQPNIFANLFGGNKKKEEEKPPEQPKQTNWWTLN